MPKVCPNCGADFKGDPIPQEYIDKGYYGEEKYFSRCIGIYDTGRDCTVAWQCPDCKHEWPRV